MLKHYCHQNCTELEPFDLYRIHLLSFLLCASPFPTDLSVSVTALFDVDFVQSVMLSVPAPTSSVCLFAIYQIMYLVRCLSILLLFSLSNQNVLCICFICKV